MNLGQNCWLDKLRSDREDVGYERSSAEGTPKRYSLRAKILDKKHKKPLAMEA